MKNIFNVISSNPLFNGISCDEFKKMYPCFSTKPFCYKKNDTIIFSGDTINSIGMILSGCVQIIKEDINGNINILTELSVSELFGEVFVCANINQSPVTVIAAENSEILFINYRKIITSCQNSCTYHIKLIENMLTLIAKKNLMLNRKIEVLSKRSTRDKILCFLDLERGSEKKFAIPYNREEMANYLCVDRSAMSNELCKMRDEGLILFDKNKFEVLY